MPKAMVAPGHRVIVMRDGVRRVCKPGREYELTDAEVKAFTEQGLLLASDEPEPAKPAAKPAAKS